MTVHEVQFGNTSNLIPLSTLLQQAEVAKVIVKAIQHNEAPPALTVYGSTKSEQQCAVQQAIAGVLLGTLPLPKYTMQDILPYLNLPCILTFLCTRFILSSQFYCIIELGSLYFFF